MLTALACGLAIAACGSSSNTSTSGFGPSSASKAQIGLEFARCMRDHGVSDFPDPSTQGNISVNPSEVSSPAFQTAQQACQKLLPNKGPPPQMTASERRAAVKFSECMRTHGEPDFPDPTQGSSSGSGPTLVLNGMLFPVGPGLDPKSPEFQQAAERCGIRLPTGPAHGGPLG